MKEFEYNNIEQIDTRKAWYLIKIKPMAVKIEDLSEEFAIQGLYDLIEQGKIDLDIEVKEMVS